MRKKAQVVRASSSLMPFGSLPVFPLAGHFLPRGAKRTPRFAGNRQLTILGPSSTAEMTLEKLLDLSELQLPLLSIETNHIPLTTYMGMRLATYA